MTKSIFGSTEETPNPKIEFMLGSFRELYAKYLEYQNFCCDAYDAQSCMNQV